MGGRKPNEILPRDRDVTGRVVDTSTRPAQDEQEEDDEYELVARLQNLGLKRLDKIKERHEELKRQKAKEEKTKDIKCFHTTKAGVRCSRDRLWREGL